MAQPDNGAVAAATALLDEALSLTHNVHADVPSSQRMQAEQYLLALRDSDEGLQLSFYLLAHYNSNSNNNSNNSNNNNMTSATNTSTGSEVQLFWALNTILHRLPQLADTLDAAQAEELLQTLFAFVHRCFSLHEQAQRCNNSNNNNGDGVDNRADNDNTSSFAFASNNNSSNTAWLTRTRTRRTVGSSAATSNNNNNSASSDDATATLLPAEYVLNKHAQLLVVGVQAFYPARWASFFDRLFALYDTYVVAASNSSDNCSSNSRHDAVVAAGVCDAATLYVLRVFDYLDECVVATSRERDRVQRTRDANIKDAMREAVLPRAVSLWHGVLCRCHAHMTLYYNNSNDNSSNNNSSNNNNVWPYAGNSVVVSTDVYAARLCLSVMQAYIAWADVQLFVTEAWRALLYVLVDTPPTRVAACEVLLALVSKKQLPGWKMATLQELRVLDVLPRLLNVLASMVSWPSSRHCDSSGSNNSNSSIIDDRAAVAAEREQHDTSSAAAFFAATDASSLLLQHRATTTTTLLVLRSNSNNSSSTTVTDEGDESTVAFAEAVTRLCTAVAEQLLQLVETMEQQQQQQQQQQQLSYNNDNSSDNNNNNMGSVDVTRATMTSTRRGNNSAVARCRSSSSSNSSSNNSHHNNNGSSNDVHTSASGDVYVVQDMPYEVTPALLHSLDAALHGVVSMLLRLLRIDSSDVREALVPFVQVYVKCRALRAEEAAGLLYGVFAHTRVRDVCADVMAAADEDVVAQRKVLYHVLRLLHRCQPALVLAHLHQLVLYTTTTLLLHDGANNSNDNNDTTATRPTRCVHAQQQQQQLSPSSRTRAGKTAHDKDNNNNDCEDGCLCSAADTEAMLRYFYELGECIKLDVLRSANHIVTQLFARVLMCDAFATHTCAAVQLAYIELLDRYSVFFVTHRAYIAVLLQRLLLQPCGVVNACARVRARVCCVLGHLLTVLKGCLQPYAADMVAALHSILVTSSIGSSTVGECVAMQQEQQQQQSLSSSAAAAVAVVVQLLPADCRQLYEAIGILLRILLTATRHEGDDANDNVSGSSSSSGSGGGGSCDVVNNSSNSDVCVRLLQDVVQSSMARLRSACNSSDNSNRVGFATTTTTAAATAPMTAQSARDEAVADAITYLTALLKGLGDVTTIGSNNSSSSSSNGCCGSGSGVSTPLASSLASSLQQQQQQMMAATAVDAFSKCGSGSSDTDNSVNGTRSHGNSASRTPGMCSGDDAQHCAAQTRNNNNGNNSSSHGAVDGSGGDDNDEAARQQQQLQQLRTTLVQLLRSTTHDVMRVAELWCASLPVREAVGQYFHQAVNTLPYSGVVDGDVEYYLTSTLQHMSAVAELSKLLRLCVQIVGRVGARAARVVTHATPLLWCKLCDAGAPLSHAAPLVCMGVVSESAREMVEVYRAFFAFLLSAASRGCAAALLCVDDGCLQSIFAQVVGALGVPAELELPRLGLQLCTQLCLACTTDTSTATSTEANDAAATAATTTTATAAAVSSSSAATTTTTRAAGTGSRGDEAVSRERADAFLSFALYVVLRSALRVLCSAQVDLRDAKNALLVGDVAQLCKALSRRVGDAALEVLYDELVAGAGATAAMQMCVALRDAPQVDGVVKAQLRRVLTAAQQQLQQQQQQQQAAQGESGRMTCDS